MSATIEQTIGDLRKTLVSYIEATYHIGDPTMVRQRRRLLDQVGGIYQDPYLESTPRYVAGSRYAEMAGLPDAVRDAFVRLSDPASGAPVIFDPPYRHQEQSVRETLVNGKNLMVMTGTGSGKTESFLLPILGKLALEAKDRPRSFRDFSAVRAVILYPMNALVNDQLGRLRLLFGNPLVVKMFEEWAGRPARFARYTSRTPYAGVRMKNKDGDKLASIGNFFASIELAARRHSEGRPYIPSEDEAAFHIFEQLKGRGKWPAKESVADWYGKSGERWLGQNGEFKRAILREHDAELMTRHEVHEDPPDLLITNYSMLEYMMMRPIERPIFDKTRAWLKEFPEEKILVVMDEAHLYRGAQGAEVGLLLRRFRERLGIEADRFQVICATASFNDKENAGDFGAQLTGVERGSFEGIKGDLAFRTPAAPGSAADVAALNSVDIDAFYSADSIKQAEAVADFIEYRGTGAASDVDLSLHNAMVEFAPFNLLVNETMKNAIRLTDLSGIAFPGLDPATAAKAIGVLLALGSRARTSPEKPSLLPCRIHSFFRGLPGLWICMDAHCSELAEDEKGGPAGKMHSQPRDRCQCGAPVLEYFTCRNCGTSYARAYTKDVVNPKLVWAMAGQRTQSDAGFFDVYKPLDILLEEPAKPELGRPAVYDLNSGLIDPDEPGENFRIVFLQPAAGNIVDDDEEEEQGRAASPGEFVPCACCRKSFTYGQSSVQDHQTKGDQPFQALLSTQIKIQPPGPQPASEFAPLRGRKVLIFSDSRQMAARLAPLLQSFSLNDTVRALFPLGLRMLASDPHFGASMGLDNAFQGVVVAAHRYGVRVRPPLNSGEAMPPMAHVPSGTMPSPADLMQLLNSQCPSNLLSSIVDVLRDSHLGLEALAIATVCESSSLRAQLAALPPLPGIAEDEASKLAVGRAWLRCWIRRPGPGIWFKDMPQSWWTTSVTSRKGDFKKMSKVLTVKAANSVFKKEWLPRLLTMFTQKMDDGGIRVLASRLSLEIGGRWCRCQTCKSVHRPIGGLATCIDCGSSNVAEFVPEEDAVFMARKGFYRTPVAEALYTMEPNVVSLIAAEHTAQLNAAQPDDAFSLAENHEIRFQDVNLAWRGTDAREPAIDILSSTTTMEVGIDIGALSGVALRNMPPGRANYQQRAGRAGRRGNAVATVVAFGSSDSHDDHYFVKPDEMIRGDVVDPRLTLENEDIARRHVRAFLLQRYHEARTPNADPQSNPTLFSVLGKVGDFRNGTAILNRRDLALWLEQNREELRKAVDRWLPSQLSAPARQRLIDHMIVDVTKTVDDAIGYLGGDVEEPQVPSDGSDAGTDETAIDDESADPLNENLLDRLLYQGVLPRYAFPTDVAPFYVFNKALSTRFRPKMDFAPTQGLNIALSQYAPNKQIWIKGKQYTSKAIYSPYRDERSNAWKNKKLYFECSVCNHAKTETFFEEGQRELRNCEACQSENTFGPGRRWFRPPGFAHPVDRDPVTRAEDLVESAYATRAKLVMSTPMDPLAWLTVNDRVRAFPIRERLLVSNSGPDRDGYVYCTGCGRIESEKDPEMNLSQPHAWPFPTDEEEQCPGFAAKAVVLGTDFVTDISLFALRLEAPFNLRPGNDETNTALRTICEAMAKAACRMLEIESGEMLAEYRPAFTLGGAAGSEVEVFIYDTLSGGAGFSTQLASRAAELFALTLEILGECPDGCDASCYRCLRTFRNKIDHGLLDRKLGEQVLRAALNGGYPDYPADRIDSSLTILFKDLERQLSKSFRFERHVERSANDGTRIVVPILATRLADGREGWITLSSSVAAGVPVDLELRLVDGWPNNPIICAEDQLVRRHLPAAVKVVDDRLAGL
jgi:ATP-dependent helicase YprA (DUF1998 family)